MSRYETAMLLITLLKDQKIEAYISIGGVEILIRAYQRKTLLDILEGLDELLRYVHYDVQIADRGGALKRTKVIRIEGRPVQIVRIKHKETTKTNLRARK